jgi:hypothetical protein
VGFFGEQTKKLDEIGVFFIVLARRVQFVIFITTSCYEVYMGLL